MMGRGGRRRKQLLDDLEEKRIYCNLKRKALHHTVWETSFGKGYGPVKYRLRYERRKIETDF
jgi:hypothetical protein